MSETAPVARSPIAPRPPETCVAGWAVSGRRSQAALRLVDCTPLAKVAVRAPASGVAAGALGVPLGRAARRTREPREPGAQQASMLLVGAGPGEWLALSPPGTGPCAEDRLRRELSTSAAESPEGSELVTVVDLTHGRALVRLTGGRSRDLLAKECALDLRDEILPDGAALRCAVAGLATDLVRDDRGGAASYLLHCERSSGQYLWDALLDAGREFGVEEDGFVPPGI